MDWDFWLQTPRPRPKPILSRHCWNRRFLSIQLTDVLSNENVKCQVRRIASFSYRGATKRLSG